MIDMINHPQHYEANRYSCEPADLTTMLPHPIASAVEYILRAPYKGSEIEDLKKALWWLERALNTKDLWDEDDGCLRYVFTSPWDITEYSAAVFAMCTKSDIVKRFFYGDVLSQKNVQDVNVMILARIQTLEESRMGVAP